LAFPNGGSRDTDDVQKFGYPNIVVVGVEH
jgi:hypothetical protein